MTRRTRRTSLLAISLVLAGALPGCEGDSGPLPLEVRAHAGDGDDGPRYSDWSAPMNLGPVVNSTAADIEVTIAKDGLSLFFASNRAGGFGGQDIWVTQRTGITDPWGPPQNLGPGLNTALDDRTPSLTIDGHRMYFSSDRPGGLGGTDIYVLRRQDKRDPFGWAEPELVQGGVNTAFNENLPFLADEGSGRVLYFNSNRPGGVGNTDIYASPLLSEGVFGSAALVAELSSPLRDAGLSIRRDGLELIIASDRVGTFGLFDLWVSTRASTSEPWSVPVNLGPVVNSPAAEARLAMSFDGTTLFINGDRTGTLGLQDLWVSTRTKLH